MSAKLTPWFYFSEKPARAGSYDVRLWESKCIPPYYGQKMIFYFDGKHWRSGINQYRLVGEDRPGWHKNDQWRGLAEPPK